MYERIAAIGGEAAAKYGIEFLAEDFKKKDGFKISVERSREMGLTRQDYCGCLMSLEEARKRRDGRGRRDRGRYLRPQNEPSCPREPPPRR